MKLNEVKEWSNFKDGKNIILCEGIQEVKCFLEICRKNKLKWLDGTEIRPDIDSAKYKGNILFSTSIFETIDERRLCYTGFDKTKYVVVFSKLYNLLDLKLEDEI